MAAYSSALALAVTAGWCPDCPPAQAARAWVLSEAFWSNAAYALLPFMVVGVAVRWFVVRIDRAIEQRIDARD